MKAGKWILEILKSSAINISLNKSKKIKHKFLKTKVKHYFCTKLKKI